MIYFDTSMLCALVDNSDPQLQAAALDVFRYLVQNSAKYEICISKVVDDELDDLSVSSDPRKKQMAIDAEKIVGELNLRRLPLIVDGIEAEKLAEEYEDKGVPRPRNVNGSPKNHDNDRLHVAVATLNGCKKILSFDFEDIINEDSIKKFKEAYVDFQQKNPALKDKDENLEYQSAYEALAEFVETDAALIDEERAKISNFKQIWKEEAEGWTKDELEKEYLAERAKYHAMYDEKADMTKKYEMLVSNHKLRIYATELARKTKSEMKTFETKKERKEGHLNEADEHYKTEVKDGKVIEITKHSVAKAAIEKLDKEIAAKQVERQEYIDAEDALAQGREKLVAPLPKILASGIV